MATNVRNVRGLTLLDPLPDLPFEASDGTTSTLHQYFSGSWGVLFSHPDDFTPICTTELGEVARLANANEFHKRNVKLLGLSCNSVQSHLKWIQDVQTFSGENVGYPIIADTTRKIAAELGMLSADDLDKAGLPLTVRSVFVVDPQVRIRLTFTYPASTGRSFPELLRVIDSLQLTDSKKVATPANWQKGDPVIITAAVTPEERATNFPDATVTQLPSGKEYLRFTKAY